MRSFRPWIWIMMLFVLVPTLQAQRSRDEQPRHNGPGTGNPDEHQAPWTFAGTKVATAATPITLYWLPLSREEMTRSPLQSSRALVEASVRCVGLQIVLPDDRATIEKLGLTGSLPLAVLVDRDNKILRRVDNVHGALRPATVEEMVRDELAARDAALYPTIADARKRAAAGDKDRAIALYRKVWDDRCLFPLAGREAQHALKDLGVIVKEVPPPPLADPNLKVINPTTTAPPPTHT